MSLLDTASLIVTPNGYKEGKLYSVIPSDGSGDLSVTRATTATRVNSAGLVELVPYNLNTNSENFTTSWGNDGTSTTTNNFTTAPNGTMTAAKVVANFANGYAYKSLPVAVGTYTLSFYVKASAATTISIDFNDIGAGVFGQVFNLTTEWQRVSFTHNVTIGSNLFISYSGLQLGVDYYIWGAQLVEGSTAKDYQKTETRLNIPRLDYSNGTCPSLLVEPQRTNLALYSSSFDNAAWLQSIPSGTITITPNYSISPDGTQNADRFVYSGGSSFAGLFQLLSHSSNVISIYVKSNTGSNQIFRLWGNDFSQASANLTATTEWQRFDFAVTGSGIKGVGFATDTSGSALDISVYGFQFEAGSYATSYIPTTSASVTRNADVISKTGISSLIGQTEGTMFFDVYAQLNTADEQDLSISDGTGNNRAIIRLTSSGTIRGIGVFGGNLEFNIGGSAYTTGTRYKIALAYKNNDVALYVNGTSQGTSSSTTISGTLSRLGFDVFTNGAQIICSPTNAVALWETRLTNTQLAQLTSI